MIAISEFTKARLHALLGFPASRIPVVLPIRPATLAVPLPAEPEGRHPAGEYFLTLGNVEPRKNHPGLIAAYARLKARRPDAPPLHIAGHAAWGQAEAEAAVDALGMRGRVHFTGYLGEADRRAYLAHCTAYVSASLYEGWGLPLFEALEAGRPAAYHAGTSQEEFARGMALSVDCRDAEALSRAMETLWRDTVERERLRSAMAAGVPGLLAYDLEGALRAALAPLLSG